MVRDDAKTEVVDMMNPAIVEIPDVRMAQAGNGWLKRRDLC